MDRDACSPYGLWNGFAEKQRSAVGNQQTKVAQKHTEEHRVSME